MVITQQLLSGQYSNGSCFNNSHTKYTLTITNKSVQPLRGCSLWGHPCSWVRACYHMATASAGAAISWII